MKSTSSRKSKKSQSSASKGIPGNYRWMSLSAINRYVPEMQRLGVSEVARSQRGFLTQYKKAGGDWRRLSEYWQRRRMNFVKRHMAQYTPNPTYRRYLALIAWAYMPSVKPKESRKGSRRGSRGSRGSERGSERGSRRPKRGSAAGAARTAKSYDHPSKYSKAYCLKTACNKMGFSQRASCRRYKDCYH